MKAKETQFEFAVSKENRSPQKGDHRHGHRARLRARFLECGGLGMPDYELLELLLAMAIPRRDVKPLAKRLIDDFGSYAAVLAAETSVLMQVDGLGEAAVAALKTVKASADRLNLAEAKAQNILSNWEAVSAYLQSTMAHLTREQFRLLFLDRKNALISDEVLSEGTIDQTAVYPREIIKKALALDASALILVHNHPSGDPSPNQMDIAMTREVSQVCSKVGIKVHDHIIVGKFGQTSFRTLGLMKK